MVICTETFPSSGIFLEEDGPEGPRHCVDGRNHQGDQRGKSSKERKRRNSGSFGPGSPDRSSPMAVAILPLNVVPADELAMLFLASTTTNGVKMLNWTANNG
ncbi:hypothetical protein CPC08DRAFT_759800 [Agrocybe pediades]|nr:hypothetical protein CPC08DRAFT_759800 [Agrocybe pediades]